MKVGDYIKYKTLSNKIKINRCLEIDDNIYILDKNEATCDKYIIKSSPDITDLLQPMDLIYVDIDNNYAGGITVPRIAETQAELNLMIDLIKSGKWILKGVVTNEQLDSMRYKVGE